MLAYSKFSKSWLPMSISDKNAYSKSNAYLNQVCNESIYLASANCVTAMFHLKGEKLGSEPRAKELGTEVSASSCLAGSVLVEASGSSDIGSLSVS